MSMRDDRSRDHVDTLIDDVARSMTEGAPPVSLRAAVRARVEERQQWTAGAWRVGAAAAAAVFALVVGLAMFGTPGDDTSTRPGTRAERNVVTSPSAARSGTAASTAAPDRTEARPRPATAERAAMLRPSAPVVVAPIDVRPLDEPPLQIEPMELPMPLRAERLEIDLLAFR
jgi:hypothetical protein